MQLPGFAGALGPYEPGVLSGWLLQGRGPRGLHTQAVRYTSRLFDVADGDLAHELSWDRGDTRFKIHKPWLKRVLDYCEEFHIPRGMLLEVGPGFGTFGLVGR